MLDIYMLDIIIELGVIERLISSTLLDGLVFRNLSAELMDSHLLLLFSLIAMHLSWNSN